jgi:hypothetical protein
MADFTPTQGRYLAFIYAYIQLHGCPLRKHSGCLAHSS